ncbi:cytochrome P450 [Pleomassaria siparia CBS 279.74]|uniref:Cytochrome P450 n=1 Tax=Pleomassaria siparia CBS 279.74 TaxID=1314801 RepID=A0A6G1KM60_9PLEO|nr:cytochrome P450 [Pleomassaria siparia CBS 279.74]
MPQSIFIVLTLFVPVFSILIHRLFIHPLSKVPGPKLAGVTSLWLAWHMRKGKNSVWQPGLHKKYGNVVRIAPNEVLLQGKEEARSIYGAGSPYVKGPWYQVCAAPDARLKGNDRFDLLTEMNKEQYRNQRRAIGPAYSIAGIEKHAKILDEYLDVYMQRMRGLQGQWVDLTDWIHIFALDALSLITLGTSPGYTEKGNDGGNMVASDLHWAYFTVIGNFPRLVELTQYFPKLNNYLMMPVSLAAGLKVPVGLPIFGFAVPNIVQRMGQVESARKAELPADRPGFEMKTYGKEKALPTRTSDEEVSTKDDEVVKKEEDLLASLLSDHITKTEKLPPSWVLHIALTNFGAGHDTLTITISACIYHLVSNPEKLKRLKGELKDADITPQTTYTETVNRVPYTLACSKEAMRLTPPLGIHLQRLVPASGASFSSHYLPPGTRVGINLWALHYSPSIFPDPDTFNPDRWIGDGSEECKRKIGDMDACWLSFGGGSRSCPGQHLARVLTVKFLVAMFGVGGLDVEVRGTPWFKAWFSCHMGGIGVKFREPVDRGR